MVHIFINILKTKKVNGKKINVTYYSYTKPHKGTTENVDFKITLENDGTKSYLLMQDGNKERTNWLGKPVHGKHTLVATTHTHGNYRDNSDFLPYAVEMQQEQLGFEYNVGDFFSPTDFEFVQNYDINGYLASPAGILLKYDNIDTGFVWFLDTDIPRDPNHPLELKEAMDHIREAVKAYNHIKLESMRSCSTSQ